MKIVDFESYKKYVNSLDRMTQSDSTKININFNFDENISDKMKKFFDVADGNPEWNV